METNYLCKCGHLKNKHVNSSQSCYECLEYYIKYETVNLFKKNLNKICVNFKLDNLALLEQKYNQNLIKDFKEI